MKIVQITDPHLEEAGVEVFGGRPDDALAACLNDIEANHADAALCVITGDLTQGGHPAAYRRLANLVAGCKIPIRLLIGNHDRRAAFRAAFPSIPVDQAGFVQCSIRTSAGTMLLLDTVDDGRHSGTYCDDRLTWLAGALQTAPRDRPVYLFMHHPPFDVGLPAMDALGIRNREPLAALIAEHRDRIRHIFFGHLHRPISGTWRGIGFSGIFGTNHQVALDLDRADVVTLNREPPAYAVALLGDEGVVVHTRLLTDAGARFEYRLAEPEKRLGCGISDPWEGEER
jgi:3',5'-cyclic AMP phosphodiesterase CpdA